MATHDNIARHNSFIKASAPTLWKLVADLRAWPDWNPALQFVELEGTTAVGTEGRFFLKSGPPTRFEIVGHHSQKFIQLESPLGWLTLTQELRFVEIAEGTIVTYELTCSGRASKLVSHVLAYALSRNTRRALVRLKAAAEANTRAEAKRAPKTRRQDTG